MIFNEQPTAATEAGGPSFQDLKCRIHRMLIERVDLTKLELLRSDELAGEIGRVIEMLISEAGVPLSRPEKERLVVEVQHETFGLGPIEPLLASPEISDILVNNCHNTYVERGGRLEKTDVVFRDNSHLLQIIERIVHRIGRRIDESSPFVDARLPDGSRVNAIIPPLALDGPALSIRRFGLFRMKLKDMLALGSLDERMARVIEGAVKTRLNILICGGTGTGKTTLLNMISEFIPEDERIVTIEDSAELQLKQDHVVRLETRPANIEGAGEVTQRDLVRNALRMRPNRIILGEVRGGEALDMLQAMNTGHEGSISTIHANTVRDAMSRMETMVMMTGLDLPERAIREQIASAIDMVIHLVRFPDGSRKIVKIAEITGMESHTIVMQDIFLFDQKGVDAEGRVVGEYRAAGLRPGFADRFKVYGFDLPPGIFDRRS
ncbi:CpaF family protein [Geomesophilobacter sediminis]|uniref:CpaF family protein n=1 Tax=Geomesophilobacter sediminis TaxID=2798584 RepID=A0A8J7J4F1_9BACT|nr:CpaF family protein [Geomesophilobacter sediminis]MBJ6725728.1 CpaF family protein [Geomesophilobacter sediminis]